MAVDTDSWHEHFLQVQALANEVLASIQERDQKFKAGQPEASRMTALARRKLGQLNTKLDSLTEMLDAPECASISEQEKNRRRDLITALRNRREMMLLSLKRDRQHQDRQAVDDQGCAQGSACPAAAELRCKQVDGSKLGGAATCLAAQGIAAAQRLYQQRQPASVSQALSRASLLEASAKGHCPAAMPGCRASLLDNGSASGPARETAETADRDLGGVLRLQQETMQRQELDLEDMERQVNSTKHLALTINEELSLQEGLLERFEEEVDVTHSKLRVAQKRIKNLLRNPGDCKCTLLAALLMCVLIVIVLVAFKIIL